MTALVLGGVVFQGFEIPERINFGGEQKLAVHRQLGGARVVDAMGPDPHDIKWSGIFQGGDAVGRARALDALRISGAQTFVAWGGLAYPVVVKDFSAHFERFYQVPYEITLCVLQGDTSDPVVSLDDLLAADFAIANFLVS